MNCFIVYDLTNHPPPTAYGNSQLTFRRNLVGQLIGTFRSRKRTGRKRSLPIGTTFPNLFHTLQKVSGRANCVFCVQRKTKKKLHPVGVNRQHINVSSVTFHCAVWGVFFGIVRAAKCGSEKLGE